MNKKALNQLLFLLSCLALQNNAINGMKRSIELISSPETTEYSPPPKKPKLATHAAALVCDICSKSFSNKSNLTVHEKIHTGERPYSCSLCNKSFTRRGDLAYHEKTHTGEKPFSCSFCNKSFYQKSSLIVHARTHTGEKPFSCSFCDKNFSQTGHLTSHEKTHTGEKPFSCSFCNKSFARKSHLTKHMKSHTHNSAPTIHSSKASSKKAPTNIASTHLVPLVIQKTIENAQTQKNEIIIQEAMKPFNDKDFTDWISSEKNS